MDSSTLDGNAIAGLLREIFAAEMTTVVGTCGGCCASEPLGAVRVYRGAGVVLRCPHCDGVLGKIVKRQTHACVDLSGLRALIAAQVP